MILSPTRNPRITAEQAAARAEAVGIRVSRKWDGHYLFYLPGNRTVSIAGGRPDYLIPPRLAVALRRAEEAKMANVWGMDRDNARSAFRLGGWVEVKNTDSGPPSKGQILEVHKKSCLVRLQGASIPRDVKLTNLRASRVIATEMAKITPKTENDMPPDFAPRPTTNGTHAVSNSAGAAPAAPPELSDGLGQLLTFFSRVKEAKDGMAGAVAALEKAEREVHDYEAMLVEAKKARDAAKALRDKYEGATRGLPQNILDMMQ